MKLKNMTKEELEVLSYTDITYMMLNEEKKALNTPTIFKKISNLLKFTEEEYTNRIGDFFTSLTTDKRFILLETSEWDLKEKHVVKINLDEEEVEEVDEDEVLDEEEIIEDDTEDLADAIESDDIDDVTDDTMDLSIVNEEELDEI